MPNTASAAYRTTTRLRTTRLCAPLLCVLSLSQGCALVEVVPRLDLKRMTYEALRREDCRLNQLEDFCQRTFANDYMAYERLRREFERDRQRQPTDTGTDNGTR